MKYAIHKSIKYTAEDINKAIENCKELPGVETSLFADGWIIADPSGVHIADWSRSKDDYRIETYMPETDGNDAKEEIVYDRVVFEDGKIVLIKD